MRKTEETYENRGLNILAKKQVLQYYYNIKNKGRSNMLKKVLIHTRRGIRFIILFIIAAFLILGAVAFLYKPTYSVWIEGEQVGYTEDKAKLQRTINEYVENGNEENENIAFVQIDKLPEYKLCLLKKGITPNDDEIIGKVKESGTPYYRYYAVAENNEEKLYVANFTEAEGIINGLKEKNSANTDNMTIVEKYETDIAELTSKEEAVEKLYVKPTPKPIAVAKKATGSVNTATAISQSKTDIGISLIRPISGVITSRFGARSSIRSSAHTGLDISASRGTPIKATAGGTVTFSGRKGSYGNMVVITHSNGIQTYYGHCDALYVTAGQTVSQGATIAAVGSTGNSTGPHLHLEVRINGVAYNPQNYVY